MGQCDHSGVAICGLGGKGLLCGGLGIKSTGCINWLGRVLGLLRWLPWNTIWEGGVLAMVARVRTGSRLAVP